MRLLRTDVYDEEHGLPFMLEEFPGQTIPPYAILSHTWEQQEVLFADLSSLCCKNTDKKGWSKIQRAAKQAAKDGYDYIWIDTCCIDKSSSAELSEAINSMYEWYRAAEVCYAYLADVPLPDPSSTGLEDNMTSFSKSRWFTRGWTLQELLAPQNLIFFTAEWNFMGSKGDLCNTINAITKISVEILTGENSLDSVSIAKRMSWAAKRLTTRLEDMAYCLMGIFSVNMPLLYGEGTKAFVRLQEEIMKHSEDHSIFAWVETSLAAEQPHGLLADSPAAFAASANIVQNPEWEGMTPFDMSNRGLRIDLYMGHHKNDLYIAALDCRTSSEESEEYVGIYLQKLDNGNQQYARVSCAEIIALSSLQPLRLDKVFVQQQVRASRLKHHYFRLREKHCRNSEYEALDVMCRDMTDAELKSRPEPTPEAAGWVATKDHAVFKAARGAERLSGAVIFQRKRDSKCFVLLVGFMTAMGTGVGVKAYDYYLQAPDSFGSLRGFFEPEPPGELLILGDHRISVDVQPHVRGSLKMYDIDVTIEAIDARPVSQLRFEARDLARSQTLAPTTWKKITTGL